MLKLHGFPMSPNTRRARLLLEELGLPYDFVNVDLMTAEHRGEEYRALNPTMRVPTLVDADFTLWESNAILVYLAEKHASGTLAGDGARERGEIARWMFMNAAHLSPSIARIFAHTIRLPEDKRIPRIAEEGRADVERCLGPLDAQLDGKDWITGRFTIADISIAPALSAAPMLGIDLAPTPNVAAWMQRMADRPSWKKLF
jgi:glutathione S-transferase